MGVAQIRSGYRLAGNGGGGLEVAVKRLLIDNGAAFRFRDFAEACKQLGISHKFTRPTGRRPMARLRGSSSWPCGGGPIKT